MRALAYYGKNDVRVVDKPEPRIEHPEDAIVRVTTAAICGSDLHLTTAWCPTPASATPSATSASAPSRK